MSDARGGWPYGKTTKKWRQALSEDGRKYWWNVERGKAMAGPNEVDFLICISLNAVCVCYARKRTCEKGNTISYIPGMACCSYIESITRYLAH